jgi:hypothetical protein
MLMAESVFNPFSKQRFRHKNLEKIKWCIRQVNDVIIARLHDETPEIDAVGLIDREIISPGRLLGARDGGLVLLAEALIIMRIALLSLAGICFH